MSSYDLFLPKQKYLETERQLKNNADNATRTSQSDRYLNAVKELRKERSVQELIYAFTTDKGGRLDREKSHWLEHGAFRDNIEYCVITQTSSLVGAEGAVKTTNFVSAFLEHCILPRCLLSPMDADYCSRLLKTMHECGTPGWHTLMMYDRVRFDA